MPVSHDPLAGYPRGSYSDGGIYQVELQTKVAWTSIDAMAAELAPSSTVVGTSVIQYPGAAFGNNPFLRVHSFTWQPLASEQDSTATTDSAGLIQYAYAVFSIIYRNQRSGEISPSGSDPAILLTHVIQSGGQAVTEPTAGWKMQNGLQDAVPSVVSTVPLPDDIPVPRFIATSHHAITWPRVPEPVNWEVLETKKSYVNSEPFQLRGYLYPREALLYTSYSSKKDVSSNAASDTWEITLNFESKVVDSSDGMSTNGHSVQNIYGGHNHFFCGRTRTVSGTDLKAGWYRIYNPYIDPAPGETEWSDHLNNSLYKATDFNNFFIAGT